MANLVFKVGSLDLSQYVRVNPDNKMDVAQGDMIEPAFSDSPLFEGQTLTSLHIKNKEMKVPLFLHPPTAPYTQDPLNYLIQQINQALRPVSDLGLTVYVQMQLAQASNPTFFTLAFGRFEPDFNFRITEKGWFAGELHLWVQPYGHTATERSIGTFAAPAQQSGLVVNPASMLSGAYLNFATMLATVVPSPVPTNLALDPSFENPGASPWAGINATSALVSVVTVPAIATIPDATQALQSMAIASSAAAGGFALPSPAAMIPVAAATGYQARVLAYVPSTAATIFANPRMLWHDVTGASTISISNGATTILTPGTWMVLTGSYLSPAGAALVDFRVSHNSVPTVLTYFDEVEVMPGASSMPWGAASPFLAPTYAATGAAVQGDVTPQFDVRVITGSYLADDGKLGIISALPLASYNPIVPVASFIGLSASAGILGASGAWGSQILAMDQAVASAVAYTNLGYFSFALSPGSVYAGENRVLGLVRARTTPFTLRAFDNFGQPLGPTAVASSMDGWQVVDYGVLRVAPWQATVSVQVKAYPGLPWQASGMVSPQRNPPTWTKEHGPIFVVPNDSTILDLDWNSPVLAMDGFDGGAGVGLNGSIDQLGNAWTTYFGSIQFVGNSAGWVPTTSVDPLGSINNNALAGIGSQVTGDFEVEGVFTMGSQAVVEVGLVNASRTVMDVYAAVRTDSSPCFTLVGPGVLASVALSPVWVGGSSQSWSIKVVGRGSQIYATLAGPSGWYAGSASGAVASLGAVWGGVGSYGYTPGVQLGGSIWNAQTVQGFRARALASTGYAARDVFHLNQPLYQNTRMSSATGIDIVDLQNRQRGPVGAITLPVPSLGAGLFVAALPFDQGPANDVLNVDVRVRERFTYAR